MATTEFTIDRETWRRGDRGLGLTLLLNPEDNTKCCLGFYASSCGLADEDIEERAVPISIPTNIIPNEMHWLLTSTDFHRDHSEECGQLLAANDSGDIPETERESKIAEVFAKQGITVKFIN